MVYTIGYSGFAVSEFIRRLMDVGASVVIDVRSVPYSRWYRDYNRETLAETLRSCGIYYRNYAREFGARQEGDEFFTDGCMDFVKFAKSEQFREGLERIRRTVEQGYVPVLMCAETDPVDCHRSVMVGREIWERLGVDVIHIVPDSTCTQRDVEAGLVQKYGCGVGDAYALQNRKIGWHK